MENTVKSLFYFISIGSHEIIVDPITKKHKDFTYATMSQNNYGIRGLFIKF